MRLEVTCPPSISIMRLILDLLDQQGIQLCSFESTSDHKVYLALSEVEVAATQQLLSQLRRIEGVDDARIVNALPSEIEHCEVQLLMDHVLFPVVLIDRLGVVRQSNQAFEFAVGDEPRQVLGCDVSRFIKGFSLTRWFNSGCEKRDSVAVHLNGRLYQADIIPIGESSGALQNSAVMLMFRDGNAHDASQSINLSNISFSPLGLVAKSNSARQIISQIQSIANEPYPVLIFGEPGVGKKFYARLLNQSAGYDDDQALVIDCSQRLLLDDPLIFDKLFSIKTVILDGVERLSVGQVQAIVALLEQPLASEHLLVMTSSFTPAQLVEIWGDKLFYSLVSGSLGISPLRRRKEDIVPLAESWLTHHFARQQVVAPPLSRAVKRYLAELNWPGNISQLWHVLRDTLAGAGSKRWQVADIKYENHGSVAGGDLEKLFGYDYHSAMRQFERMLISHHYPQYPSTRQLAKKLGLSHTAVANKLRVHSIR